MAVNVGTLSEAKVDISVPLAPIRQGLSRAVSAVRQATQVMSRAVFSVQGAFAAIGVGVGLGKALGAWEQQERAVSQLNATLASTKGVAGFTSQELQNLGSSLQKTTTFGDEATIASSALLLTFTQISRDVFPRAQKAILDLSTAMGTDLRSATAQVGKALNNPILGMSALQESGIQFTESQKALIKELVASGDMIGAQTVMLKELETQFGGSAEAARNTFGGALKALQNSLGDVTEQIGAIVAPTLESMANYFNDVASSISLDTNSLQKSFFETFGSIARIVARVIDGFTTLRRVVDASIQNIVEGFSSLIEILKGSSLHFAMFAGIVNSFANSAGNFAQKLGQGFKIIFEDYLSSDALDATNRALEAMTLNFDKIQKRSAQAFSPRAMQEFSDELQGAVEQVQISFEGINEQVELMYAQWLHFRAPLEALLWEIGSLIDKSFAQPMTDALVNVAMGMETLNDAFKSMLQSMTQELVRFLASEAVKAFIRFLLPTLGGLPMFGVSPIIGAVAGGLSQAQSTSAPVNNVNNIFQPRFIVRVDGRQIANYVREDRLISERLSVVGAR